MSRHPRSTPRLATLIAVAALLLAGSLSHAAPAAGGKASRADAIARGFGGDQTGGGAEFLIDGRWLAGGVMLATAGVAVGIALWQLRKWHRRRKTSVAGVEAAIGRTLRLGRRERLVLRHAAAELGVEHPTALLLCPSVLRDAKLRLGPRDALSLNLILDRLAM